MQPKVHMMLREMLQSFVVSARRVCWIFSVLAFVGCAGTNEDTVAQSPRQQDPRQVYEDLRKTAREFIEADSVATRRAEFDVSDGRLYYSLGRVNPDQLGLSETDPYLHPFEAQIRIELLRNAFGQLSPTSQFIRAPLERADSLVYEMVAAIVSARQDTSAALASALEAHRQAIDEQFRSIEAQILSYAKEQGLRPQKTSRGLASDYFSVKVSSNPSGGTIRVLPFLEYRKHIMLGRPREQLPWRTLAAATEDLIGRYFFLVSWPDGKQTEGQFQVRNPSDVTLPNR